MRQLISYIAPGAPATRRAACGGEPFIRPEIGFTPRWFRARLGVDFGERWHTEPAYRRDAVLSMRAELHRAFPGTCADRAHMPLDLLTGTYGACTVAALYGIPILYAADQWPVSEKRYLSASEVDTLAPPDLDASPFFQDLMAQANWIAAQEGRAEGFINWQGVLNNAQRLRGEALFEDLMLEPERCLRLFDCVCTTMIDAARRLHVRQRESGVEIGFFTVSNCLVNMIAPDQYRALLLPFDQRLAAKFACIGIHNCAWNANPYLDAYAEVPGVGYIDMGIDSDLRKAKQLFPDARRAIMYTPMDAANKPLDAIRDDFSRIARAYGPCDIVLADIDAETPDERVWDLIALCGDISGGV